MIPASSTDPLIRLQGVGKDYPTPHGDFTALQDINLEISPGEFIAILGRSGAGKSTLVNMITGVDSITRGEVEIGGISVHKLDEERRAVWRGRNLGVVYQSFQLLPGLTLLENVLLPVDLCGEYKSRASRERAMRLLQQVELEEHAHKLPAAISGGQQQRLAIARALANDPPILVADEPTGRLDSVTSETVFKVFLDLVAAGKTIVMVTHDNSLAERVSRTVHIADGRLVAARPIRL